ncbi:hypothetical protein [Paraburkholderia sartisoli]|uniref:Plasmid stabilization protein n=1 Tax=Paraburkholderia sartisoli TaxID=83784 RepID=A0A1H4CHF9_9BURK|nr:hypothetical protein [Paraburkholderia sartisoli]SEA59753.1 hypothetical protein SAMN05192564_102310 [Paraburkholderia sartisoli]
MKARSRLCIELGKMKPGWDDWCAVHDVTPAEGVRQLILDAITADEPEHRAEGTGVMRWTPAGEHRERIEIRLTVSELRAVGQRAAASGFTTNRWVVALIRAQLTRVPQFGEQEMALLAASSHVLATISRSLGSVIRELERDGMAVVADDGHLLTGLKAQIDVHLRAVSELVRANIDRWSR